MMVAKLIPIGEPFNLFDTLRDKVVKPYFPNDKLDSNDFQVLMQYDLQEGMMTNSFYKNVETFLLNEGIIVTKGDKFISTPKTIEIKKFKTFEEFENPINANFRKLQMWFNGLVGLGAIFGGIAACISAVYAYKTYKDEYLCPPKLYPLDIRVQQQVIGYDTLVVHDTVYLARPTNKLSQKK